MSVVPVLPPCPLGLRGFLSFQNQKLLEEEGGSRWIWKTVDPAMRPSSLGFGLDRASAFPGDSRSWAVCPWKGNASSHQLGKNARTQSHSICWLEM